MIRDFLMPQMEEQNLDNSWFQQDGATPYAAKETARILNGLFPGRLISHFLWGYLKKKVYVNKPQTLD